MFIRSEKNKNYSVINNTCFRDSSISARAKGIFAYIMTLPDNWELKKYELCNHFSEGRKAIDTAFKELEEKGYVSKIARRKEGGLFEGWDYTINEIPDSKTDLPEMDESDTDESVNGQADEGEEILNTYPLNTEALNTEEASYSKKTKSSSKKFKKPTHQELENEMIKKEIPNPKDEAQKFLDYYESVGWVIGGSKKSMKSWKAAVSTWKRNINNGRKKPNGQSLSKEDLEYAKNLY